MTFHVKHKLQRSIEIREHLADQNHGYGKEYGANEAAAPADRKMRAQKTTNNVAGSHWQCNRIDNIPGPNEQG